MLNYKKSAVMRKENALFHLPQTLSWPMASPNGIDYSLLRFLHIVANFFPKF